MAAVFLDRDGVVNELVYHEDHGIIDSPFTVAQFRLLPGVIEAVRQLHDADYTVVLVSNQPGIAKGHMSREAFDRIKERMKEELAKGGACLDGEYYCLHHPEAVVAELRTNCECRKPKPGLLLQAAQDIDIDLWNARGFINALVVPLIAISAAKNPKWSPNVFVSRHIMLHTTAILGAGVYLMIMALGGFYIREFSGTWGGVAQIIFFFGAIVLLLLLMFSGSIRAWLKVFLNKHFYNYKYDYRDEWMRFTKTLAKASPEGHFRERAIKAIAEIIDSTGGVLWLKDDFGNFSMVTHWNMPFKIEEIEAPDSSLVRFLEKSQWIIDLDEYCNEPDPIYMDCCCLYCAVSADSVSEERESNAVFSFCRDRFWNFNHCDINLPVACS